MEHLIDFILAVFLITNLMMAASSRLMHCVKVVMIQGLLLGLLPLFMGHFESSHMIAALLNISIKGIALPYLLIAAIKRADVCRELEPLVGYGTSLLIVLAAAAFSFFFCGELPLPDENISFLAAPVAFTTILTGLFLIVSRKKAITQAIGFLTFENGITAFGAGMALEYGLVVELGILLDVFVLVFVMGIAVFRISREFQHIDSDRLNTLGDWSGDDENEAEMKGEN